MHLAISFMRLFLFLFILGVSSYPLDITSFASEAASEEKPTSTISPSSHTQTLETETEGKIDFWTVLSHGMIVKDLNADGKVVGGEERKLLFSQGDLIYFLLPHDRSAAPKEWVLYKKITPVYHPGTGTFLGDLIEITGTVRIIDQTDSVLSGVITRSKGTISIGDKLAEAKTFLPPSPSSEGNPSSKKEGSIVEVREGRLNSAEQDIVYLDQGREDGIFPGTQFEIIHNETETSSQFALPPRKAGRLLVLSAQARTSTARIIQSLEPIVKGDLLSPLPSEK
ncbi:MAG: hypothetical protein WAO55_12535 [Candidatus Manganitrophaceae bacterium]